MIQLLIIPLTLVAAIQDWKSRTFLAWVIPALWLLCTSHILYVNPSYTGVKNILLSTLAMISILTPLLLYLRIKFKSWSHVFDQAFAPGDLLFLLAISPLFSATGIMLYLMVSSTIAIFLHLALVKLRVSKPGIPFITYAGATLIVWVLLSVFKMVDLFHIQSISLINV